ncbi:carbonic anhydrase [Bradyrhizobium sp. Arg314]
MDRRSLLKGLAAASLCPLCVSRGFASEGLHWSYEGETGPDHWGSLAAENAACSVGSQQSPIDIAGATKADLPPLKFAWQKRGGKMVNNGHTIQLNVPPGGKLTVGDAQYELVQFHFHAPSEHLVGGKHYPMEAHFVHQKAGGKGLGVIGVFIDEGAANHTFKAIAGAFPKAADSEADAPDDASPQNLLPRSLKYWKYAGSLTTPPCAETVDWMVCKSPITADKADIAKFTALYPMNARPAQPIDRRFVLRSS